MRSAVKQEGWGRHTSIALVIPARGCQCVISFSVARSCPNVAAGLILRLRPLRHRSWVDSQYITCQYVLSGTRTTILRSFTVLVPGCFLPVPFSYRREWQLTQLMILGRVAAVAIITCCIYISLNQLPRIRFASSMLFTGITPLYGESHEVL